MYTHTHACARARTHTHTHTHTHTVKESSKQLPPSPPHHSMQNKELFHPKKKMDINVDYAQLPSSPSLWQISRSACPSCLRGN